MLYYIITLLVLIAIALYQYCAFIRIYYIGKSLETFREVRHSVTMFMSYNVKDLSVQEANEYRLFLTQINGIIKHFGRLKTEFTKFSSVKNIYINILLSSVSLVMQSNETTGVNEYKTKACEGIVTAFKAIPFYRARLFIFCLKIMASVSFLLGIKKYVIWIKRFERLHKIEKDMLKSKGMPCN
jgi:hypothetical protein